MEKKGEGRGGHQGMLTAQVNFILNQALNKAQFARQDCEVRAGGTKPCVVRQRVWQGLQQ